MPVANRNWWNNDCTQTGAINLKPVQQQNHLWY